MKTTCLLLLCLIPFFTMAQNFSKIDELLKNYDGNNPGAALAIIKHGKLIYKKCYGLSDVEARINVTDHSNFRLASVSKQFTAAAILQLIQKNKLTLTTKLSDCFPSLPSYAQEITIQHLLNHTSGILDYDVVIDESATTTQLSDADVLKACMSFKKTYFLPGDQYRYSNTAYVILGLIVEKYSGLSYPDYLAKYIFKPLKMKTSIAFVNGINEIQNRAYGYSKKQGNWIRKDQSSTSATLGDGGIYSNLSDFFKWDAALYSNKILPQSVWLTAFAAQNLNNGTKIDYGFGWHLKKWNANKSVIYHTGSTTSFRNVFYRLPDEKLSIILFTNRNTPEETNMVEFAEKILSHLII